jgi:hypothetical protein
LELSKITEVAAQPMRELISFGVSDQLLPRFTEFEPPPVYAK